MTAVPTNKSLYNRLKNEGRKKFDVWPSAYGSAWLVKTYKKMGGKYSGKRESPKKSKRKSPKKSKRKSPKKSKRKSPKKSKRKSPKKSKRKSPKKSKRKSR